MVAATSMIDIVIKPNERARQCMDVRLCYQKLLNERRNYTPEEYELKSGEIGMQKATSIEGLQYPAYNDTVIKLSHDNCVRY